MKKLIYFLLLIFSFCCFFSCSNVNSEYDFAQENKKNEQTQDKVFVTFKLKKGADSRTILPTEISLEYLESLTDLELYYLPYNRYSEWINGFGTDTVELIKKFSTVEEMENTAIEWTYCDISKYFYILLYAKGKDGTKFSGISYREQLDSRYYSHHTIDISLSPDDILGQGTGALDLVFNYPAQIQSLDVQLYKYEDKTQTVCDGILEIDSANNVFTYKHAALPADIYELCVTLYTDAEKKYPVNKYKEIVVITSGGTSSASRTLGNANNEIYKITYDFDGGAEFVENAEYPEYYSLYCEVKLPDVSMIKSYEGKTFDGWYIDGDSYTRLDSLKPGEHVGDILLKAGYCYETDKDGFEALLQTLKDDVGYTVKVNGISTAEDLAVLSTAMDNCKKKIALDLSSCTGLTEIPDDAFYEKKNLLGIVMPDTVEVIGEYAFGVCENMLYANMPKNLKTIKDCAFLGCESLGLGNDTELIIPDGCESIGDFAFGGNISNGGISSVGTSFTSVTIPASVISVGYSAFADCPYLKNIYSDAEFFGNPGAPIWGYLHSLETVHLGKNTKTFNISEWAHSAATDMALNIPLKEIHFSGTLEEYLNIQMDFYGSLEYDLYIDGKLMTDVVIPEGVTEIKACAFRYANITSVTIPDSVTSIGLYAFDGCDNLKTIRIGTGIKSLPPEIIHDEITMIDGTGLTGYEAKYYYNGDIAGLLSIDGIEFDNWKRIASLYINNELVTDLVIPDGVTEIKKNYFSPFSHQFDSITIPRSVTKIEPYALAFMSNYEKVVDIYYQGTMQEWMNMDYIDDEYSHYSSSGLQFPNINLYIDGQLVTDFVIPDGIEEIPDYKFCNFNFSSVSIPDSVKKIGKAAFYNTHLKSVNTGAGCKEVEDYAFAGISELEEITFGDSVETIGDYACIYLHSGYGDDLEISNAENSYSKKPGSLKKVTLGKSVKSIGEQAFYCLGKKGWTDYASPLEEIWYTGDWNGFFGITWGAECFKSKFKLFIDNQEVSNVEFSEGVTSINADLINQLGLANESITIPASVTQISGFFGYSVKNIYYKGDIASWCNITRALSSDPMAYNYNLYIGDELVTDLVIPADVTTVAGHSFNNCSSLKSVSFEDGSLIKEIGESAFSKCTNLETVNLCEGLESIGEYAFHNCWDYGRGIGIKDFVIPDSVTSLGEYALGNSGIKNLTVGSSLKMLYSDGDYGREAVFSKYNDNLDSITLRRCIPGTLGYSITSTFIEQFASIGVVYVPSEEAAQAYKADDDWSKIADIIQVKP